VNLPLSKIRLDGGTQPRVELSLKTVARYSEAMKGGDKFPPVVVFHDGSSYWLADGFHRIHSARDAGASTVDAEIRSGTKRDAILYAVGANMAHDKAGRPRSNEDKRQAVAMLLSDEEWAAKSDRWIAERCHVSDKTVAVVRREVEPRKSAVASPSEPPPRLGKDGKARKLPAPKPPAASPPPAVRLATVEVEGEEPEVEAEEEDADDAPAWAKSEAGRRERVRQLNLYIGEIANCWPDDTSTAPISSVLQSHLDDLGRTEARRKHG
jgi:hypothetical protein